MKYVTAAAATAAVVCAGMFGGLALTPASARADGVLPDLLSFQNASGQSRTFSARGVLNPDNPVFQDLGTNGRSCVTCHQASEGWTMTPAGIQQRFDATAGLDPVFRTTDGSNCGDADVTTVAARRRAFSLLLSRGLIRVGLDVPAGAEFTIESVDDPYHCGAALTSAALYRRPLPATNLRFLSAIMWDGRESPGDLSMRDGLLTQARDATLGHAQAALTPTDAELQQIVDFELGLNTAQATDTAAGGLGTQGATGGPMPLSRQPFFIGVNDPLGHNPSGAAFDPRAFTLFTPWGSLASGDEPSAVSRAAIARGQELFNTHPIAIAGVSGLNDELHASSIPGTCTTCHDTPNVGNHSVKAPLNIGLTDPERRTADMPLYTLRNLVTGEAKQTTDPGRAMITGKWKDVGRFKGPILRGLASRAPYFHNGFAATLLDVVNFYDSRFAMGLTAAEKADLVAFLQAL
jgi:cytochrome c peroxidase